MNTFLFGNADRKVLVIARIGIMLALTVVFQYLTGLLAVQLLTGSVVNLMLIISGLLCGLVGGIVVGLFTPLVGFALGMVGNILLVPFVAVGNALFVALFLLMNRWLKVNYEDGVKNVLNDVKGIAAVVLAALVKFLFLFFVAYKLLLPLIMPKVPAALATTFGVTQMFTALIGGTVAFFLGFVLNRIFKKGENTEKVS